MPANSEEQRPQQRRSGDAQDTPAPAHAVSDNGMKAHLSSWTGKHEEVEGKHEEAREAPLPQSPPPSDGAPPPPAAREPKHRHAAHAPPCGVIDADVPIADRRLVSAELDAQRSTAFRGARLSPTPPPPLPCHVRALSSPELPTCPCCTSARACLHERHSAVTQRTRMYAAHASHQSVGQQGTRKSGHGCARSCTTRRRRAY